MRAGAWTDAEALGRELMVSGLESLPLPIAFRLLGSAMLLVTNEGNHATSGAKSGCSERSTEALDEFRAIGSTVRVGISVTGGSARMPVMGMLSRGRPRSYAESLRRAASMGTR